MRIIGITGRSGSGKNTVAGMLAAELADQGYTVKLDAFALPIKWRLKELKRKKGLPAVIDKKADRLDMQNIGAAVRAANSDYYICHLISRNRDPADFLIVTDVRYPNEAKMIKDEGGVLIHIEGSRNPLRGEAAEHESESHSAEVSGAADLIIVEQSSLERLVAAVKAFVAAGDLMQEGK